MRTLTTLLSATALVATLLPGSALAAAKHHRTVVREVPVQRAAVVPPNPAGAVVGGAVIGAVIGAVVCPPCAIAGTALASGGGALVGGGIGAVSGGVVAAAATPPQPTYY